VADRAAAEPNDAGPGVPTEPAIPVSKMSLGLVPEVLPVVDVAVPDTAAEAGVPPPPPLEQAAVKAQQRVNRMALSFRNLSMRPSFDGNSAPRMRRVRRLNVTSGRKLASQQRQTEITARKSGSTASNWDRARFELG
jgi:hypothetical protein